MDNFFEEIYETWLDDIINTIPLINRDRVNTEIQDAIRVNQQIINNLYSIRRFLELGDTLDTEYPDNYINRMLRINRRQSQTQDSQNDNQSNSQNNSQNNQDNSRDNNQNNSQDNQDNSDNLRSILLNNRNNRFNNNVNNNNATFNGNRQHTFNRITNYINTSGVINRHFTPNESNRMQPIIDGLLDNLLSFMNNEYDINNINNINNMEDVKVVISDKDFDKIEKVSVCDENIDEYNELNCNICFENYKKEDIIKKLKCNHIFHNDCLHDWLCKEKVTCPTCRKDVRENLTELNE